VSTVVEVEVVVVVCSVLAAAPAGDELASVAVRVVCKVWIEMRVCVVVKIVVGAAAPWLLGDGIGRGETMTEEITGATAEPVEIGTAAPLELTGSGMIVSVTGVTPADKTGVTVVVSVPIVNDRE